MWLSHQQKMNLRIAWKRFSLNFRPKTNFKKLQKAADAMSPSLRSKMTLENLKIVQEQLWGKD